MKTPTINAALFRLTLIYTGVLLAISLIFSLSLYGVSSRELDNNVNLQMQSLARRPELHRGLNTEFTADLRRDAQLSKDRLKTRTAVTNISVLVGGALLSYYLARKTLRPIEEAHQARARFTADASHELRTPIAAMRAEIDVTLRDKSATKKELANLLNSNNEELIKLTNLSDSLLKIARGDTEEKVSQSSECIEPIIGSAIRKMSKLAKQNQISLVNQVSEDDKAFVCVSGLEEVLVILFDNAIKYSGKGTVVTCSSQRGTGNLVLIVSDNGKGMKPSEVERIFERFFRADNSRSSPGHGLGLALARQSLASMNASIAAEINNDSGMSFKITLQT